MSKFSDYARMLGRIKTPKKALASRKNGRLGGRPKLEGAKARRVRSAILEKG